MRSEQFTTTDSQSTDAAGQQSAIDIHGLTVDFRTPTGIVHVLRDVNFDVNKGEVVGIVGESGSGKSMTALSVMKLLPRGGSVVAGEIDFDGIDLVPASNKTMRAIRGKRIGMVFQDPMTTLDPVMTVGYQIDEAYRIHHPRASRAEARAKTLAMLELVGVPDAQARARQYPHQWSGGMRQRAVIAMALVNDPELVIADEPTTALDATIQAQVLDVLVRAQKELGVSIIIITHDLGVVAQVASRVIVMYAGSVIEVATTEEIFTDSRHPYSQALMDSRPSATTRGRELVTIPGRPPAMSTVAVGCPFAPRCAYPGKNERCVTEKPLLEQSRDGRLSACHFRDQTQRESVAS